MTKNWWDEAAKEFGAKYIYAIRTSGEEWQVKMISKNLISLDETKAYDDVPMGTIKKSEIAIFRIGRQWEIKRPMRYHDFRDHSNKPIPTQLGIWLINQADAGYF